MKPNAKKYLKIGVPILGVAILTTFFVCVSGVLVKVPTVSVGGSTAVLPLINSFANSYNDIDIMTSAGGSGAGINSMIDGTKIIGMASKKPNILKFGENGKVDESDNKSKIWKEKNIKTLTIAWDGIGIVYKPSSKNNSVIDLDKEKIAKIYAAFSGFKEITFNDLGIKGDNTKIIPYARNGGASVSGTADAFWKDSNLDYKDSEYWKGLEPSEQEKITKALEFGSYNTNVIQTAEANSQAWNRVKEGGPGSMIYLSSGFILNNIDTIKSAGFEIATYNGNELKNEKITNGYNWYRPFNLMYSINQIENNVNIVNFLKWIYNKEATSIIEREGYVPIGEDQMKKMGWNGEVNNFDFVKEKADWELIENSGA